MLSEVKDRSIGSILAEARGLNSDHIEHILAYQKAHQTRFGEAAVALGMVSADDVLYALSQQFHYPHAAAERRKRSPELIALNAPFSVQAESFRAIRSKILMRLNSDKRARCALAVTSPESRDGKTFFSANLAITLAQMGSRTLLVDGDLRGPRLHEVFGLDNAAGLSGILSGRTQGKVIQEIQDIPNLSVLPVGIMPPNPLELLEGPAFGLLMRELVTKFDHVLVDTPAAYYGSDCSVIAARCGAVLVVARQHRSQIGRLQDLVANLSDNQVELTGVVVNEL